MATATKTMSEAEVRKLASRYGFKLVKRVHRYYNLIDGNGESLGEYEPLQLVIDYLLAIQHNDKQ